MRRVRPSLDRLAPVLDRFAPIYDRLTGRSIAVRLAVSALFWSFVILLIAGLILSTLYQVWRFENVLTGSERGPQGEDRHYVPRFATTTGDLDIHELGVMSDGRIIFVNTLYSCLRP